MEFKCPYSVSCCRALVTFIIIDIIFTIFLCNLNAICDSYLLFLLKLREKNSSKKKWHLNAACGIITLGKCEKKL